jgi:hypothetical protein
LEKELLKKALKYTFENPREGTIPSPSPPSWNPKGASADEFSEE